MLIAGTALQLGLEMSLLQLMCRLRPRQTDHRSTASILLPRDLNHMETAHNLSITERSILRLRFLVEMTTLELQLIVATTSPSVTQLKARALLSDHSQTSPEITSNTTLSLIQNLTARTDLINSKERSRPYT